jgi:hypothetical protein
VRHTGRDHDDVAGGDLDGQPVLPAEPHFGRAAGDAEHLVRARMVVVLRVDAVAPGIGPAIGGKQPLASGGTVAGGGDRAAVDDNRQPRVVRNDAVIAEAIGFDDRRRRIFAHRKVPR